MKTNKDILHIENTLLKLENLHASFDYLRISIASPKRIKSWAERQLPNGEIVGEILKPETINFRTHHPELNGLFCEKILGQLKIGNVNVENIMDLSLIKSVRNVTLKLLIHVYVDIEWVILN